ncbi:MAG TPA: patatin-like phospholipase family protein [Candidatus Saccharimonadales bacterium]|nr:patatin-like phospholipase family protein [Candidatus Saccharimonadales bacterium]
MKRPHLPRFSPSAPRRFEMGYTGDTQVIKNLFRKKTGDSSDKKTKTVLIFPGGGQRGVSEAGVALAIEKFGLINSFDYVIGASTGAGVGYYMLSGETALGTSLYFEENVKNHLINFLRLWKLLDLDTLEKVIRTVKPVSLDNLIASTPKFLVSITDKNSGKGELIDVKKTKDPPACIIASMCMPVFDGGKSVLLNGRCYVDGALSNPLPITHAIEKLGATDIFIALSIPLGPMKKYPKFVPLALRTTFRKMISPGLREEILTYNKRYNEEVKYLTGEREISKGVRIFAIYPRYENIAEFSMQKELLEEGALSAQTFAQNLFTRVSRGG